MKIGVSNFNFCVVFYFLIKTIVGTKCWQTHLNQNVPCNFSQKRLFLGQNTFKFWCNMLRNCLEARNQKYNRPGQLFNKKRSWCRKNIAISTYTFIPKYWPSVTCDYVLYEHTKKQLKKHSAPCLWWARRFNSAMFRSHHKCHFGWD